MVSLHSDGTQSNAKPFLLNRESIQEPNSVHLNMNHILGTVCGTLSTGLHLQSFGLERSWQRPENVCPQQHCCFCTFTVAILGSLPSSAPGEHPSPLVLASCLPVFC